MAVEQFANALSTTLASGYTSGGTSIAVTSATGFPASGIFRVSIFDQATGNLKLILKVTAVSGTTFTTTPESSDANCSSGDIVRGTMISVGALAQMRIDASQTGAFASLPSTTGQLQGNRYKCTDAPIEFIFDGTNWIPYVFGYKVTLPVLGNFTQVATGNCTFDTTHGGILVTIPSNSSSQSVQVLALAIPGSGAYTVDLAFTFQAINGAGAVGVGLSEGTATSNKFAFVGFGTDNGINNVEELIYNSTTSFNSRPVDLGSGSFVSPLIWLRVVDDRTTNRTFYVSTNGYTWDQVNQESRTNIFTPADAIIAMTPFSTKLNAHLLHFLIH